jgi:hypothetical protein
MQHETPSQAIFNEIKEVAIEVWKTKDNTYGYVDEKIETINKIDNYADNVMVFYRMFDWENQILMKSKLSQEALLYVQENK